VLWVDRSLKADKHGGLGNAGAKATALHQFSLFRESGSGMFLKSLTYLGMIHIDSSQVVWPCQRSMRSR
jgi:hypothetical protein